jgi:hypothetical protein
MQNKPVYWIHPSNGFDKQRSPQSTMPARQCGTCTSCCQGWLKGSIRGHEMYPGQPCHYVLADSCSIYASRPVSPCRDFSCAWQTMPQLFPDDFWPERAGFIVKRAIWDEFDVFFLVPAGKNPGEEHLNWMTKLCHATGIPFFYIVDGETTGYGPAPFVERLSEYRAKNKPVVVN